MGKSRGLIIEQILAVDKPPGFRLLADFLADLGHEIPRTPTMERLAAAFRKILAGADAARALELTKKRGQREGRTDTLLNPVAHFIAARIETDLKPRGAQTRALNAAAEHFRRTPRQMERLWRNLGPAIRQIRALQQEPLPGQQLVASLDAIAKWGDRVWRTATPRQKAAARAWAKRRRTKADIK